MAAGTHCLIGFCAGKQGLFGCRHRVVFVRSMPGDRGMQSGTEKSCFQRSRSNIRLDRKDAESGGGNQSQRRKAVGGYCSEDIACNDFPFHYSVTVRVPDISSWPSPQNTSQIKVNLPVLSGINRTVWTAPAGISART